MMVTIGRVLVVALGMGVAACSGGDRSYYPQLPGAFWRYGVTVKTTELTRHSKYTVLGLAPVRVDGRVLARTRVNDALVYLYDTTDTGIYRVGARNAGAAETGLATVPVLELPVPAAPGTRWTQGTVTAVLEATVDPFRRKYRLQEPVEMQYVISSTSDEVVVPAGRFRDCLRVTGTGSGYFKGDKTIFPSAIAIEQTDWYAPGVGLVRSQRVETTTSKVLPRGEYERVLEVFEP